MISMLLLCYNFQFINMVDLIEIPTSRLDAIVILQSSSACKKSRRCLERVTKIDKDNYKFKCGANTELIIFKGE